MVDPVRRGAAGPEGVLQKAVEAFYHPVGLRVVGGGLVVLDVYCCGGGDRNCLRPAGCPVNDSEQVGEPLGGQQGPHQVHVDMAETARRHWNVLRGYLYMAVNFGPLAA